MIKTRIGLATLLLASFQVPLWAQSFETLHQFTGENGRAPEASMTLGPDGRFYGVTTGGGLGASLNTPTGGGVLFRYSPTEGFKKLKDFDQTTTGSKPTARLLNIGDGYLYGANFYGGTGNGGTVFRLDPLTEEVTVISHIPNTAGVPRHPMYLASGEPNVLHVLCEDTSGIRRLPLDNSAGSIPLTLPNTPSPQAFIRASNGSLYGGTYTGGTNNGGVLFKTNGDGTGYEVLHNCQASTGTRPIGAMVQAPDGMLYGLMSHSGLPNKNGVLYRLNPNTNEVTQVHFFTDYSYNYADLMIASDGMLYGTGWSVGPGGNGNGGIWRIKPNGTGYKALFTFATGSNALLYPNGRKPVGGLVQGPDGHIYGTTQGGIGNDAAAAGTIFRLKLNLPPPPLNRAPIAVDDAIFNTGDPVEIAVLSNDFDPDDDALTVTVKTSPTQGVAQVQPSGTILYTPTGGHTGVDSFTYEISDSRGGKSIGAVQVMDAPVPPAFVAGSYNGLVSLDENLDGAGDVPRGQFTLKVDALRKFTGTLLVGKKRIPLKGTFGPNNTAELKVNLPAKSGANLFLVFEPGQPSTVAAVVYGAENWTGEAGPVRPLPQGVVKQTYTVQIEADPTQPQDPQGHGYGAVTIKADGSVLVVGKLGDGSPLKWMSTLTELPGVSRAIPVYSEPLKDGVISGLLFATPDVGRDFAGTVRWNRSAAKKPTMPYALGFQNTVQVTVGRYIAPTAAEAPVNFPEALVDVRGTAAVPNPILGSFEVDGKKIITTAPLKTFTVAKATGIFSGTILNGRKVISFKGALNQGLKEGRGQFIASGVTGRVEVGQPID
jgi:uncharacterized repeat protein (TIGR03803 family)